MTEAEWQTCADPMPMLGFLFGKASERKYHLFVCACCRRLHLPLLTDKRFGKLVDACEAFADGAASAKALKAATEAAKKANRELRQAPEATRLAAQNVIRAAEAVPASPGTDHEKQVYSDLLREIFSPLVRPVTIAPAWLSANGGAVERLARAIYEGRAFDRLPTLADALEGAGCTNPAVLDHCRSPGPHVPGCWVVDLLLGKE